MYGREREDESEGKSLSINFLFNVSAPVPLWQRENASPKPKFAGTASWRHRSEDPEFVVGKAPRWMSSAKAGGNGD